MGWRLALSGLPEGYEVVEYEDGLRLLGPANRIVAEFAPLLRDLETVKAAAWEDAGVVAATAREKQPVT